MLWQDDSGLFSLARTCPAAALPVPGVCLVCLLCSSRMMLLTQENSFKLYFPSSVRMSRLSVRGPLGAFDTLFTLLYTIYPFNNQF